MRMFDPAPCAAFTLRIVQGKEWSLLFASGIRGQGGAVLIFKSPHLLSGDLRCA